MSPRPDRSPIEGPWEHHEVIVHDPATDGSHARDSAVGSDTSDGAEGLRLHYVAAGPEDGDPVLLLHGFPQFWYAWHRQLPVLADAGYRVIAPDLRGYNRSERPHGVSAYRLDRLVGDVRGLLDALGYEAGTAEADPATTGDSRTTTDDFSTTTDEPSSTTDHPGSTTGDRDGDRDRAAIVGHDWGALLAWEVAGRHPEVVDRLGISNGPHPAAYLRALRTADQLRRSWYVGWFQVPGLPERLLGAGDARALEEMFEEEWFDDVDRRRYRAAAGRPGALRAAVNYYRALGRQTVRDWLGRPVPGRERPPGALRAREIDVPTLVLWGMQDPALSPRLVEDLDRWVGDLRVERFPDVDHWLPAARPDAFADHLLSFLGADRT